MKDREILNLLNPRVQSAIKRKWQKYGEFREVQKKSIPVIVKKKSCLIISPTAGGKTEAALLPLFSNIYNYGFRNQKVQAIYIAPLKALLNDLDNRISEWIEYLGDLSLFKWHGDVSTSFKKKHINNPETLLLSTPESLDVILASSKIGVLKIGKEYWVRTYAGTMINQVISFIMNEAFPEAKISYNFKQIDIKDKNIITDEIKLIIRNKFLEIKDMNINDWVLFLSKHLKNFRYSKFSEYIPYKYSVKYAASSYFSLEGFKDYLDKLDYNITSIYK